MILDFNHIYNTQEIKSLALEPCPICDENKLAKYFNSFPEIQCINCNLTINFDDGYPNATEKHLNSIEYYLNNKDYTMEIRKLDKIVWLGSLEPAYIPRLHKLQDIVDLHTLPSINTEYIDKIALLQ